MIITLWIAGMIFAWIMTAYLYKSIELGKMLIAGTGIYFSIYVVSAGILIWKNTFNITTSLIIAIVVLLLLTVLAVIKNGLYLPKIKLAPIKYIGILLILIAAAIISSMNTSGVYGTGQDEGLYQIRAWYYMTEEYDNVLDFSEYYNIESDTEKKEYIQYINTMVGYYRMTDDFSSDEKVSLAKGVTHGILTFPALLALWGKMFGLVKMNGILTLMFLLSIGNVWLTCCNMKIKQPVALVSCAVMTICPIIIWSSRVTLTEIVLLMFISLFIMVLTESKKKDIGLLSVIPIVAACYYHVTITIFIPLIIVIYLILIFATRQLSYAVALIISMIGYMTGFFMMTASSHAYTYSSFESIFGMTKDLINKDNLTAWIVTMSVIVIAYGIMFCVKPIRLELTEGFSNLQRSSKKRKIFGIVLCVLNVLVLAYTIYKGFKANSQGMWAGKLGSVCYLYATAFIFLPAAFACIFFIKNIIAKNKSYLVVFVSFMYVMLLYCDFMWVLIYRYYYYTRYFTPYTCIIILAGAIMLNKIDFRIVVPVTVVCGAILIWQTSLLYTSRDVTTFNYDTLADIDEIVGEKDAVILLDQGYGIPALMALPVRAATSADIYFAQDYDLIQKVEYYTDFYDNVYILLYDVKHYTDEDGTWRYVYQTSLDGQFYEDYLEDKGLPYPKEVIDMPSPFAILAYEGEANE